MFAIDIALLKLESSHDAATGTFGSASIRMKQELSIRWVFFPDTQILMHIACGADERHFAGSSKSCRPAWSATRKELGWDLDCVQTLDPDDNYRLATSSNEQIKCLICI